jgi:hypothetical protein
MIMLLIVRQGRAAFYRDSTGIGNAPEGVQIQMRLIEIEYRTENNYNDSNDPDDINSGNSAGGLANSVPDLFKDLLNTFTNKLATGGQ